MRLCAKFRNYFCSILALVIAMLTLDGESVKQELWMHMTGGYILYFNSSCADLSVVRPLFPIVKVCATGRWHFFRQRNFTLTGPRAGSRTTRSIVCHDVGPDFDRVQSLRHIGGQDTSQPSLSLYAGSDWTAEEVLLVTAETHKNITRHVTSFVATMASAWTLYEGQNLDGHAICFENSQNGRLFKVVNNLQLEYNLTTVGSVAQGCQAKEIVRTYKSKK